MYGKTVIASLLLILTLLSAESNAIEPAKRISDKEVIERLTRLEEGQKALNKRFDDMNHSFNKRFDDMNHSLNKRFDDMNHTFDKRFDDMNRSINQRFDDMNSSNDQRFLDMNNSINQRFDNVNQRLDDIMTLLQIMITAMLLVGGGMLGWMIIIWRKLVKVEERQSRFETQDDEIKFLKEAYNRLNEMVVKLVSALVPNGTQSQKV